MELKIRIAKVRRLRLLVTHVTKAHPIKKEPAEGGRFQLEKSLTKRVKAAPDKTKRDQHWRSSEEVKLWVLTHK